ncbi:hypothetical protein Q6D67_10045 [Haliea sp. E1-2-M8]|uniref:hypothetical protein n=1 Tax=Haliea sp. E1-2-M8 TaxID=3064706 RepID=UPI002718480B|nr:hypothetical protein [Haliea sp. E1-2-M8]MDO8862044.1 hypothetical protein [Haliea sp. E1-2-M8]
MTALLPPLLAVGIVLLLSACVTAPEPSEAPVAEPPVEAAPAAPAPELTLNLPSREQCQCQPSPERDLTFLERGYQALSQGDAVTALQHFQRYKRLETVAAAQWEADVAIAYLAMLPDSPLYDHDAAEQSYQALARRLLPDMQVHATALLMRDSLAAFALLNRHIADLESSNATLTEDLAKREEAIRRLRELTLGQSRGSQP